MARYFDPATVGFLDDAIHDESRIAAAIAISDKQYEQLMRAQGEGKTIVAGRGGKPVAVVRDQLSPEVQKQLNTIRRDRLLSASDWTQLPDTLLDAPEYKAAMAVWRQALRDMDLAAGVFPEEPTR